MIQLKIDNRETKLKDILHVDGLEVILENLQYADFVFEVDGSPLIFIERKTINDLAQSIKDGRFKNQKIAMLDNIERKNIYYVIEGNIGFTESSSFYSGISASAIQSCIINTMIRDDIKVIVTKNIDETAALLLGIAKRLIKEPAKYLCGSSGETMITKYKASALTKDKFFENVLMQIPGISSKTAKAIVGKFESLDTLYSSMKDICDGEKIKLLAQITTQDTKGKSRKISLSVVNNIIQYIF